jgi:predicted aldo/keto reductase-like oxidoreductase
MIYKQCKDLQLSSLGFGAMRLTGTPQGWGGPIHKSATKMIEYAYEHGINYFDTSYFYHDGESERFLGKTLKRFPRDSWNLASKLPGNLMNFKNGKLEVSGKTFSTPADIFNFQMERCGVDYFDFFMLHNVSESTYGIYTDEKLGLVNCLLEQKAKGRIRHLGFSSHGRHDTIENFINYLNVKKRNEFEFIMIQLNYLDWTLQDARKKHDFITKHGLSVFVMEPLRGGRLANLQADAGAILKAARPKDSYVAWAFRYLQSLENIPVVLSGMSTLEQLKENVNLFSKHDPVTKKEINLLQQVIETITDLVPCTSCGYCTEDCPQNLNIPMLLTMYNEAGYSMDWFLKAAIRALKTEEKPSACTSCKNCITLCPQNIDIPQAMKDFSKMSR